VFRLVRWLFLVAIIVGLAGFIVAARIRGRTPAEGFCSLMRNPECMRLADRGEALVKLATRRLGLESEPRAAGREAHETARAFRSPLAAAPANGNAPPLDRHTAGERKALSDLLLQRGSR
jgi:hypothetical protein